MVKKEGFLCFEQTISNTKVKYAWKENSHLVVLCYLNHITALWHNVLFPSGTELSHQLSDLYFIATKANRHCSQYLSNCDC